MNAEADRLVKDALGALDREIGKRPRTTSDSTTGPRLTTCEEPIVLARDQK
jgi:hypothetical protein